MDQQESTLEALRRIAQTPETWGEEQKAKLRESLLSFEDQATSDPQDDILGPALATGSSMVRDTFLQPIAPTDFREGAVPLPKAAKGARDLTKRPVRDAREEALKEIANKKPSLKDNLNRIEKLDEKQSMELFDRVFGGVDRTGLTPADARRYIKMATKGRSKEALAELTATQKQPVLKREVHRGIKK